MNITGNTVLITGGGSGIGRGLAEAFHAAGNQVIIAGRRRAPLEAVAAGCPGMAVRMLDVGDAAAIGPFAEAIIRDFPALNVLINNAGIMRVEDVLAEPADLSDAEATVATNLLGPIRLGTALLPHLRRRPVAAMVNVTSGLAFVPLAITPTYSATKAAIHSWSESMRHLLRETPVQVIEIAPPAVATDLMPGHATNPNSMPLDAFIDETMALLAADHAATEICVERVRGLRRAEADGQYGAVFGMLNGG